MPKREDVAAVIREFEDIIKKKKKISFGQARIPARYSFLKVRGKREFQGQ